MRQEYEGQIGRVAQGCDYFIFLRSSSQVLGT
jgi:hypothetical protein